MDNTGNSTTLNIHFAGTNSCSYGCVVRLPIDTEGFLLCFVDIVPLKCCLSPESACDIDKSTALIVNVNCGSHGSGFANFQH